MKGLGELGAAGFGCEVLELLGHRAMGVVYRARQLTLGRQVALKMIQTSGDSHYAARLRTEASALSRLQHPDIVQIHELGEQDGRAFLLLEYLDGGTLRQRIEFGGVALSSPKK